MYHAPVTALLIALCFSVPVTAQVAEVIVAQPTSTAPQSAEDLLDRVDAVLAQIEAHRGVDASHGVESAVLDRSGLRERLLEIVAEELPDAMRAKYDRIATALGFVDPGVSYFDLYLGMLADEVTGFYDDNTNHFYILEDTPAELQESVMAHELFHAIQDQEWGLAELVGEGAWISDVALAAQALIEGDALAVMMAYMLQDPAAVTSDGMARSAIAMSMETATAMNSGDVPPAVWGQLVFPYVAGLKMIFELVEPGDWSPIDAMYTDPPRSTEQVLHPERYRDRDEPTWISLDLGTIDGAERYMSDVLGEFMIGELFAQLLDGSASRAACLRAAQGWDGDRLEAYQFLADPERDLLVWAFVWDSVEEASTFVAVANYLSSAWLGVRDRSSSQGEAGGATLAVSDIGVLWVERWGDLALVVVDRGGLAAENDRRATIDLVVDRTWANLERSRYPDLSLRPESDADEP